MAKKKKVRTDFRKNRSSRTRPTDWTRQFESHGFEQTDPVSGERISGKGDLTRRRTVVTDDATPGDGGDAQLDVSRRGCLLGRVLRVQGLVSTVQSDDGTLYQCATRRILKTLSTDQRHVVAAGDRVQIRPVSGQQREGIIERVEPRHGVLSRLSKGRQQIIVTNVDQLLIVASAAEPYIKPNLIDRFLVTAERSGIRPLIVINKIDLVAAAQFQPLVGTYSQMGYDVLLVSARTGLGIAQLRRAMAGRENAVAGQSGVGKSSLLNAVEEGLKLRTGEVSEESQKGKHTTTTAELLPLARGGYVVDTPGLRQFQLWDVVPQEIAGFYRDLRPYVSLCRYPDCTHTHEEECAVKNAVADDLLDERRYESYCHMFAGDME